MRPALLILLLAAALPLAAQPGQSASRGRVQVRFDTTQASIALSFIEARKDSATWTADDWKELFNTDGYKRLKSREEGMQRPFTDSAFRAFILSDTLAARATALRTAFDQWAKADIRAASAKALAYLPDNARIAATVYVVVKPKTNSFVWDLDKDPAIFLYLDPTQNGAQFENIVAHELHHVGFPGADSAIGPLSTRNRVAAEWTRAFSEGFAMLAAAGGPDVHPHAVSSPADRARWDADMKNFNRDLKLVEAFFLGVITGKLETPDQIYAEAEKFYGVQGPWYTVGWKMGATIEKKFGRAEVVACMIDPWRLLTKYNEAAADWNKTHPADTLSMWSAEVVSALKRPPR
jgi:hypothetical protein